MTIANPLQAIIDIAETVTINRKRVVGIQYTRNQIAKVSTTPTRRPWQMTVKVSAAIPYEEARDLVEAIDLADRVTPHTISFGNKEAMRYLYAYRGEMTEFEIASLQIAQFLESNLILARLPDRMAASGYLFKAGDLLQVRGYPYPFTVTEDVLRGSNTTVTVPVHRGNFISDSVIGAGIVVGPDVEFLMIVTNLPTYAIVPGARGAYIQFTNDFELYEFTGDQ